MFGDFFYNALPAHELTYVERYRAPPTPPAIEETALSVVQGVPGLHPVPTLATFMRRRLRSLTGSQARLMAGALPDPRKFREDLVADAQATLLRYPGMGVEGQIESLAWENAMLLDIWAHDMLLHVWERIKRGSIVLYPPTLPPPPFDFITPPVISGPGAMGLPR